MSARAAVLASGLDHSVTAPTLAYILRHRLLMETFSHTPSKKSVVLWIAIILAASVGIFFALLVLTSDRHGKRGAFIDYWWDDIEIMYAASPPRALGLPTVLRG
jgi:hypothetical protein